MSNLQKSNKVEGFGLTLIDIVISTDKKISLNDKHPIFRQLLQVGGVVPTALILLSRLGISCKMNTFLGEDDFANILIKLLEKENINHERIRKINNTATPLATVIVEEKSGQRTVFYNKGIFPIVKSNQYNITLDKNTELLLLDGHNIEVAETLIKKARKNKVKILLDIGSPKKDIESLIRQADVVFAPEAFWKNTNSVLTPDKFTLQLLDFGVEIAVLTLGEKGSYVATDGRIFHQPAFEIDAVDTNGAGDVFLGGFAYGLIQSWEISRIVRFASAAAALSCTRFGKDKSIPNSQIEIDNFLKINSSG